MGPTHLFHCLSHPSLSPSLPFLPSLMPPMHYCESLLQQLPCTFSPCTHLSKRPPRPRPLLCPKGNLLVGCWAAFRLRQVFGASLTCSPSPSPSPLSPSSPVRVLPCLSPSHRGLSTHHSHRLRLQELRHGHHSEVRNVHEDVAPCHQRDPDDDSQGQVPGRGGSPGSQAQTPAPLERLAKLLLSFSLFFLPP